MKAEIISVGTELLLGSTINTDAADVAVLLSEYGIDVYWQTVVGDNPGRLMDAVRRARDRADLIITTGGLGPTCDDLTKSALAEAFGMKLELDRGEEAWLRDIWKKRGNRELTPNNLQQVWLPEGSTALRNDWGTAPGCYFERDGVRVIMLPGPPRELRPLLEHRVRPILAELSNAVIASHNIHFFGIGESEMEYRLRDYMQELNNPTLAPYAKTGECLVRVTAKAETLERAEEMMAPVIERVKGIFGDLVYAVDGLNLAEHTVKLLIEKGVTIAAAESCTGGELEKRITDIPGASATLKGGVVVYTNEAKHLLLGIPMETIEGYGAVSFEVAAELAERVRRKLGADLGVGVTGLAGPDGDGVHEVGTVFLSLSDGKRTWVREKHLTNRDRATVRLQACQNVFDMVRRYLAGLPVEQERADI
ncbi:MAG TPA: competence/damage-inducible protein A [Candidatus Scatomorpha pullistercoris]|uniref:Putative competence-damage inducible protein n=1 Tax=Candidatus Scatomorpha pullistercoris TaxID=2840929 RepID=A0A9D1K9D5_9FIRM|nr:competence/damage-inducible protein A [Candidatus Scatomorpha pullistercoris]